MAQRNVQTRSVEVPEIITDVDNALIPSVSNTEDPQIDPPFTFRNINNQALSYLEKDTTTTFFVTDSFPQIFLEVEKILLLKKKNKQLYEDLLPFIDFVIEIIDSDYYYVEEMIYNDSYYSNDNESKIVLKEYKKIYKRKNSRYNNFMRSSKSCHEMSIDLILKYNDPLIRFVAEMLLIAKRNNISNINNYYYTEESVPPDQYFVLCWNEKDPLAEFLANYEPYSGGSNIFLAPDWNYQERYLFPRETVKSETHGFESFILGFQKLTEILDRYGI